MPKTERIRFRVDATDKREWQDYANEHYDGNLSQLIKNAVRSEIKDEWVLKSHVTATANADANVDLGPLQEDIDELRDYVIDIHTAMDDLEVSESEGDNGASLDRGDMLELASTVHDHVPLVESPDELYALHDPDDVGTPENAEDLLEADAIIQTGDPEEIATMMGTAEAISEVLDEPEHHVRRCLIFVENDVSTVHSRIENGKRRWYEIKQETGHE